MTSCAKRLLHPGADTVSIIAQYISTIKAFRMLDPPGVLLDKVSRPIQKYLKCISCQIFFNVRERENTVSCILSGLMGDESSEMWMELNSNPGEGGWAVGEEEQGYFEDMNWEPTPIDAAPGFLSIHMTNVNKRLSQNNFRRHCVDAVEYIRFQRGFC
jgi:anaphase-promoting complex subunit 2